MNKTIKLSHEGLSQAEIYAELEKQVNHAAYPLFKARHDHTVIKIGNAKNVTCLQADISTTDAFPRWLRDNIMILGHQGIKVDLELENGALLSNNFDDRDGFQFKPVNIALPYK